MRRPAENLAHLVAALVATWVLAVTGSAHADGERLVLVDPDPALARAARVALSPWGLEVHDLVETAPGATLPHSAERARQLADVHDATAVAWLSASDAGHALWVYERDEDRVVAQPIASPPPFDEAQAAALALSLKALLRHSQLAPAPERYGATAATAEREHTGTVLGIAGGVRAFEVSDGSAEARLWLSVAHLWPAVGGALGPVLEANLGFGGVQTSDAQGRASLRAQALGLGALARWPLTGRFDVGATGLLSVRLTDLEGELTDGTPVDVRRANPTVAFRIDGGVHLGRVRLSLRLGLDVPLRTQQYLVQGQPLLSVGSVALEAGLGLEVFLH